MNALGRGMRVSIIVPILNEADELPQFLESLRELGTEHQIIFVDGGSRDGSATLVRQAGHMLLDSLPGRARQMNLGARCAAGDVLLFLHADTRISAPGLEAMRGAMMDPIVVGGRFDLVYGTSRWPYPWIARVGNLRSRFTKILTGDQTIFVRRAVFEAMGGYPEIPLMEDVEISRQLKRRGQLACLRARVVASTRKCRREGVWRTIALMWLLRTLYALGVPPEQLHRLYYLRDPGKQLPGRALRPDSKSQTPGLR